MGPCLFALELKLLLPIYTPDLLVEIEELLEDLGFIQVLQAPILFANKL